MAMRNLNYVVGADVSKAKRGFGELSDRMSRVGDCTKRLASLFIDAFGLLGLGAGIGGVKAFGGAFVGAAKQMEDYQVRLRAVIKDAGAANMLGDGLKTIYVVGKECMTEMFNSIKMEIILPNGAEGDKDGEEKN